MSPERLHEAALPGIAGLGAPSEAPGSTHVFGLDRSLHVMWMSEHLRDLLAQAGIRSPVGHALSDVVEGMRTEHLALLKDALETGTTVGIEDLPFEVPGRKTTFWDVEVVPIPAVEAVGGSPVFSRLVVILTDVTHRVEQRTELRVIAEETEAQREQLARLEQEQRREKELAEAANAVSRAIANSLDVESVLRRGAEEAGRVLGAETTLVTVRDEEGWLVKYAVGSRRNLEGRRFAEKDLPMHQEVAEDGEVKAISDAGWLSGL